MDILRDNGNNIQNVEISDSYPSTSDSGVVSDVQEITPTYNQPRVISGDSIESLSVGKLTAGSFNVSEFMQSTGFVSGVSGWKISGNGQIEAVGVTLIGSITATSGAIGGFVIQSNYISDVANSFGLSSDVTGANDVRFWAGDTFANRWSAPFRVYENGYFVASSGSLNSSLTLGNGADASGTITMSIADTHGDVYIAGGTVNVAAWTATNGFILGLDDSDSNKEKFFIGGSGSSLDWNVSSPDTLTVKGTVNATAGYIGASTAAIVESTGLNLGSTGHVRGGQTGYNTGNGFFLGYDTSTYKFSVGSSTDTTKQLLWDGTDLYVNGSPISNTPIYGNGADGDATIAVNTSLTRDMYYNNLTVNNGVILNTAGYRLFVKGALTNNGTIQRTPNNGGNGGNGTSVDGGATPGTAGTGASVLADANLAGGVAGRNGGEGGAGGYPADRNGDAGYNGINGNNLATGAGVNGSAGNAGGKGGDVGANAGSLGGTAGTAGTITTKKYPYAFPECVQMLSVVGGSTPALHNTSAETGGSSGGGGGYNADTNFAGTGGGGGGSGSAGGVVVVCARIIINNGSILASGGTGGNGGNGSAPSTSNTNGGGGGGGGAGRGGSGGVLVVIYNKLTNTGTIAASGGAAGTAGTGGAGKGTGTAGADGGALAGATGTLIQLQN